jgi:hypothetical protein
VRETTNTERLEAAALLDEVLTGGHSHDGANAVVARAFIEAQAKALAPLLAYADQLEQRVDDCAGTGNDVDEAQAEVYAEVAEHLRTLIGRALGEDQP